MSLYDLEYPEDEQYVLGVMLKTVKKIISKYNTYAEIHDYDDAFDDLSITVREIENNLKNERKSSTLKKRTSMNQKDCAKYVSDFLEKSKLFENIPNEYTHHLMKAFMTDRNVTRTLDLFLAPYLNNSHTNTLNNEENKYHPDNYLADDTLEGEFTDSPYVFNWKSKDGHEFHGRIQQQQCRVHRYDKKTGKLVRCKHMTVFGIGICSQHLKKWYHLMIAPAFNAANEKIGLGVYPYGKKNEHIFSVGSPVARYNGETVSVTELDRRYGKNNTGPYAVIDTRTKNRKKPMDGALRRGVGAIMNQGEINENNAVIGNMKDEHDRDTYGVIATKDLIASGAKSIKELLKLKRDQRHEILVDYHPSQVAMDNEYYGKKVSSKSKKKKYIMDDSTHETTYSPIY